MNTKITILVFLLFVANTITAQKSYDLKTITVSATNEPDTVFGSRKFSVSDYEFYEDKLLLLTFENNLEHAKLILADGEQKILSSFDIPDEAERLYKDYLGYVNVICKEHIYRIKIKEDVIHLAQLPMEDYKKLIMPCIDTIEKDIYFSNYQKDFPEFTYYTYNTNNTTIKPLRTVTDKEQLRDYNMEYYFLKPKDKLVCIKLADEYKVDKHRIAAHISGLTTSVFYTPLYAPLFVLRDTVCVFDHYANAILKYDKKQNLLDSISVNYNHPQNWREWKHLLLADKETNKVYALYQKNGIYQLNEISLYSGKIISTYKLTNKYVKNIKMKNGYVYYIYRPFESLQEQFVYRELIREGKR